VIVPDINLLVYAYNSDAPFHRQARPWWEDCLSGDRIVGIPWVVVLGFARIMSSRVVLTDPMQPATALGHVRSWLERPQAQLLVPGPRHLEILTSLIRDARAPGHLCTDAHLAAITIETQAQLHSTDSDFSRFPGLRWKNPLAID